MSKVLVVDDERAAREGIGRIIRDAGDPLSLCGTAQNGREAVELCVTCHPDIILTDVDMPDMDGLEMIRKIKERGDHVRFVIISGYDRFSYAQSAISLGVEDYLLKPIHKQELISVLLKIDEKIHDAWLAERKAFHLEKLGDAESEIGRERFLKLLFSNAVHAKDWETEARKYAIPLDGASYLVGVFRPMNGSALAGRQRLFDPAEISVYYVHDTKERMALLAVNHNLPESRFRSLVEVGLQNLSGKSGTYSLGTIVGTLADIASSYRSAAELLQLSSPTRSSGSPLTAEYQKSKFLREKLITQVQVKNETGADETLSEICAIMKVFLEAGNYSFVRNIANDCSFSLISYSGEIPDEGLLSRYEVHSFDNLDEWEKQTKLLVRHVIEKGDVSGKNSVRLVDEACLFVNRCWKDRNLNIDMIASSLGVNANYLRTLFKNQTGKSFVQYIREIRLNEAAKLLKEGDVRIQDVAEAVTFSDGQYFANCFRKQFGVSPSAYRESKEK